jgi:hypothetical protein
MPTQHLTTTARRLRALAEELGVPAGDQAPLLARAAQRAADAPCRAPSSATPAGSWWTLDDVTNADVWAMAAEFDVAPRILVPSCSTSGSCGSQASWGARAAGRTQLRPPAPGGGAAAGVSAPPARLLACTNLPQRVPMRHRPAPKGVPDQAVRRRYARGAPARPVGVFFCRLYGATCCPPDDTDAAFRAQCATFTPTDFAVYGLLTMAIYATPAAIAERLGVPVAAVVASLARLWFF